MSQKNLNIKVEQSASYRGKNLMWFKQSSTAQTIWDRLDELYSYISKSGAEKTGELIFIIHAMDLETKMFNVEVYVSVDRIIASTDDFRFQSELILENCVAAEFLGGTHQLPEAYTNIRSQAEDLGIELTRSFCNVIKDGADDIFDTPQITMKIYVPLIPVDIVRLRC